MLPDSQLLVGLSQYYISTGYCDKSLPSFLFLQEIYNYTESDIHFSPTLITFPVSNTHAFVFCQTEHKKNCAASCVVSCFHRCPEGFWIELQHQLWFLCSAESGHWVHLTSDLPTAPGGEAFSLRKGKALSTVPHVSLKVTFQGMLFPPRTKHHSVLSWTKPKGSGRSHEWGPAQYSWQT